MELKYFKKNFKHYLDSNKINQYTCIGINMMTYDSAVEYL